MYKILLTLSILTLFTVSGCDMLTQKENSDVIAVKKSKTDLGAMYTEKTVEEVVQDIAGLKGTAEWSSSTPVGDFSKDVKLVEVTINKPDTIVYKNIRIQFIFNRSTGYVKQGYIEVNGKGCSLLQWWAYYSNILLLNSGAFENEHNNLNKQKMEESENHNINQTNEPINMTSFKLSAIPDSLYGCSCLYSESKNNYDSDKYIYFNDMGPNCIISINNRLMFLSQVEEDIYENDRYKVLVEGKKILSSEGEGSEISATLVIIDRNSGDKITKKIYGVCGC